MARFERVEIDAQDRDQYGRVEALVYIKDDGECLNEELVRAVTGRSASGIVTLGTASTGSD